MKAILKILIISSIIALPLASAKAATDLSVTLKGRIVIQTESKGQAWYIDPLTHKRAYLGRPYNALNVMQKSGLGMSDANLKRISQVGSMDVDRAFARRFSGRILLQVQDLGQAWYVNPLDLKKYYLGTPTDALIIMKTLALGITNANLEKIPVDSRYVDTNPAMHEIMIKNFTFNPTPLEINKGDTVIWTNKDSADHNVTAVGLNPAKFSSGNLIKGETYSYNFMKAGIYDYTCTIHPSMMGRIIVK